MNTCATELLLMWSSTVEKPLLIDQNIATKLCLNRDFVDFESN